MTALLRIVAACLLLAGCVPAPDGGRAQLHPTIVSLNPCTDAILAQVAAPAQILAISPYSKDPRSSSMNPAAARRFHATGGTVEEVLALRPDLVVAGSFMPPATRNALRQLGIQVATFGIAATPAESEAQIRRMAALAGHPQRGEALVQQIEQALFNDAAPAGRAPVPAVLWQPSGIVPGKDTLISHLLRRAGFSSHSEAQGMGQADYLSLEQLLANPPAVLLIAGQERAQHHPALRAIAQMQRAAFDPALLYCGGPTIIRAMTRLRAIREAAS